MLWQMNAALIHDRLHIKTFWEKRISNQCEHTESEEQRLQKSALTKYQTTHAHTHTHTIDRTIFTKSCCNVQHNRVCPAAFLMSKYYPL